MSTYYDLLGIEPGASQDEIIVAYQQQRERYSAERVAGMDESIQQTAQQRTQDLEQAYRVLSDAQQRQEYDNRIGVQGAPAQAVAPQTSKTLNTRERWYVIGGVVGALLLVAVMWMLTDRTDLPSVGEVNRPAPQVALPTLTEGETMQLQNYRGKVVLVNFWGTWCEPCKRETPALQAAYEQLRDQGLVVVGINLTDDELVQGNTEADIRSFVEQYNVTYPIALDVAGEARKAFQIYPIPTSYFIDAEGNIRYVRVGEITAQEVTALFNALQQETTAGT
jgi:thiol-disulfide isomerase/thioredoxin